MRKIFRELSVFKKLLFSYMAILLVSVGVMIFFTNTLFVGAVRDALVQRNTDTAAALKNDIDRNIRMIDEIKNSIVLDSDYNTYFRLKDPNGVNTLKNELGKYIYTSSFIDEIALYIYGDDYLYTGTGSYSVPLFISAAYKYENWSEEELVRDLCSATEPYVRAAENVSHFGVGESPKITFVYPLVSAAIKRYGALVFIVDRDGLNTALGETAESGAVIHAVGAVAAAAAAEDDDLAAESLNALERAVEIIRDFLIRRLGREQRDRAGEETVKRRDGKADFLRLRKSRVEFFVCHRSDAVDGEFQIIVAELLCLRHFVQTGAQTEFHFYVTAFHFVRGIID